MSTIQRHVSLAAALLTAVSVMATASPPARAEENARTIIDDGFDRTVTGGLGTSPDAGPWTVTSGSRNVQVEGSNVRFAGEPNTKFVAAVRGSTAADVNVLESVTIPSVQSNTHLMAALIGRQNSSGQSYRMWFDLDGDGQAVIHLDRSSPSSDTGLGEETRVSNMVESGTRLNIRTTVSGTSPVKITGTVWQYGTQEPSPQFQFEDSSESRLTDAGWVGMAMVNDTAKTPVDIPHFTATTIDTSAPGPDPAKPTQPDNNRTQNRGAQPVGRANYRIPSGAIFVSPSGNDSNAGTDVNAPKRTVRAAVESAPSWGTVVVRAGVYHEGEDSYRKGDSRKTNEEIAIYKPLTVQNYPNEEVWFDGSTKVTDWKKSGSTWQTRWDVAWDSSWSYNEGETDPQFPQNADPMASSPDQVFVNGKQLKQVDLNAGVGEGQFAVDYSGKRLIIGTNPSGREVRASRLDRAFTVGSPDVTLRGFGVRRYANSIPSLGVIYMARHRDVVTNVTVEDVATTGITMYSDGSHGAGTIDHVTVRRAGLTGIDSMTFDNGVLSNSIIEDCNTEGFGPFPATAGVKITRAKGARFDNNLIRNNPNATGIWADESSTDITAIRNEIYNEKEDGFAGIQFELTSNGIIADNLIFGQDRGIYIFDTNHLRVVNNTSYNNRVADISVDQDFRRQSNPKHVGHDSRNPIPDPNNTWITGDLRINNNLFGTDSRFSHFQLYVLDKDQALTANSMVKEASGNAFESKVEGISPTLIGWGNLDQSVTQYNDLAKWSSYVGRGWRNFTYPVNTPVARAQELANQNTPPKGLDSDIAGMIGQSAGDRRIGSYQSPAR